MGPADYNFDESVSTLRYANRAKNIKNNAKINEDPKDALLRQFQQQIEDLKRQLEQGGALCPPDLERERERERGRKRGRKLTQLSCELRFLFLFLFNSLI